MIQHLLDVLGAGPVDCIRRQAERRRNGGSAGVEARAEADVVALHNNGDVRACQAEEANHDREESLGDPVAGDTAHELGTDAVPDGEQEHDEKHRLDLARDLDAELAYQDACQQDTGHGAEGETPELPRADPVTQRESQEDGQLRIAAERLHEPVDHVESSSASR